MARGPKPEKKPRRVRKKTTLSKNFATALANGNATFLDPKGRIDERSAPARRFRELTISLASDLGGASELSTVQGQLVKRFAGCSVVSELLEAELVAGSKIDLSQYCTVVNALNRLSGTLGIHRAPKEVMSLEAYLAQKAAGSPEKPKDDAPDDDDGGEDA